MAEKQKVTSKERGGEKALRYLRNFNLFVGGVALAGAVLAPPVAATALGAYGAFNVAQGAGFEVLRRGARKHRGKQR